jgi:uncharacterized membrane protein
MISGKNIGYVIIGLSIIILVALSSFTVRLNELTHASCDAINPDNCPHRDYIPEQTFLGVLALVPLFGLGLYLVLKPQVKESSTQRINIKKMTEGLDEEEKKIIKLVNDSNGVVFQSELMEKTDFSKVKITRILDKLEAKNLLERRRRGMSNVVILKGGK